MQSIHSHRPVGSAATADVRVAQFGAHGRHRAFASTLDMLSSSRRKEDDFAVGKIPPIEIVVLPLRQTPQAGPVKIHFVEMVEGVFGDLRFVELVDNSVHVRVVLAVGEQHLRPVVRDFGPDDVAWREIVRQAAKRWLLALEVLQHVHPAAGAREPAVVLVAHVRIRARPGRDREPSRCALHKQQIVAVQQRVGERHLANRPACSKVQLPFDVRGQLLRFRCLFGNFTQCSQFTFDRGSQGLQAFGRLQTTGDDFINWIYGFRNRLLYGFVTRLRRDLHHRALGRPGTCATLRRRFA